MATPETEARLLAVGRAGTAAHVERIVRGWRLVDRKAEAREAKQRHKSRALHVHTDADGMVVVRGRLEPEVGALLQQALTAAREALYRRQRTETDAPRLADPAAEDPTFAQRQADALALLAQTAMHTELDPGAPGERYQVVVHVDAPALADPAQDGPVGAGRGDARFRGNVAPPGVRREPGGDAAWPRRARGGDRGADTDDSARAAARAPASRPRLPLPGVRPSLHAGASHPALGARRPDDAVEPRAAVPPASPRRA